MLNIYLIIFNIDIGAIYLDWGRKGKISNWDLIVLTLLVSVSVRLGVRFFHNNIDDEWRFEFNNNYKLEHSKSHIINNLIIK